MTEVIIGVTGHRNIRKQDTHSLYEAVRLCLEKIRNQYPQADITVLSALAEGADQLCARAALEAGCRLVAALPMEPERYLARYFSPEGIRGFHELCGKARESFVVAPIEEPGAEGETDGFCYRQAGLYITMYSQILIALWDGKKILFPEWGGTYETVDFMLRGIRRQTAKPGAVWHILTPRQGEPPPKGELFSRQVVDAK